MVKHLWLFLFPVPPAQRCDRATANVDKRIAAIEQRLRMRVPPAPSQPTRVRILWERSPQP
jgi:hypothetical protein